MSPSNSTDGQRFEKFVRYPKGDPENPLSWDEMAAKFRALAGSARQTLRRNHRGDFYGEARNFPALCN